MSSSTINGGDVDCICVWIHKIYSSGSPLLSGASKCTQTINYPLVLLSLSAPEPLSPREKMNVLIGEGLKMWTSIMEVGF